MCVKFYGLNPMAETSLI